GVKEHGKQEPVNENTLFMVGSTGKAFTAMALAKLEAQGKLSLDDKVQKWLPTFKLYDTLASKEANIRDLLSHRLGLGTFQGDFVYWRSNVTREEVVQKIGLIKPKYGFRSRFGYCNAAYTVAGEIIPAATGLSWKQYLEQELFKPLQMNRTLPLHEQFLKAENIAKPHTLKNSQPFVLPPYVETDNLAAAGGAGSSANDMAKWLLALLNEGKLEGQQVLPASAVTACWQAHTIMGNKGAYTYGDSHFKLYGLGWELSTYENHLLVYHSGAGDGFLTTVTLIPEKKIGIVVLTNSDQNGFYEAIKRDLVDALLGLPYLNHNSFQLKRQKQREQQEASQKASQQKIISSQQLNSREAQLYTGRYENEVYGSIDLAYSKDHLVISFSRHPKLEGHLYPLGNGKFLCKYSIEVFGEEEISFEIKDGKVEGLLLKVSDFVEYDPYPFKKVPAPVKS
ncbi:MAG: serine hydrolase, partial [Rufibacter sp.]